MFALDLLLTCCGFGVDSQQDQLGELTSVVQDLQRERIEKEEKRRVEESEAAGLPLRRAEEAGTEGSYSLVEDNLLSQIPTPVSSGDSVVPWSFREEVARDIGSFLRRALGGTRRGTSGRDRLSLPSKFYLVVRDRAGRVYQNPVLVRSQFSAVKAICYSGGSWGDSMFVGVPTLREGQIAALAAGFGWPSQVH